MNGTPTPYYYSQALPQKLFPFSTLYRNSLFPTFSPKSPFFLFLKKIIFSFSPLYESLSFPVILTYMQPGVQLIEILNDLRKVLNDSGVERTIGLRDAMGEDCPFFGKSIYLFLLHDYPKIKPLLEKAAGLLEDCEK